MEITQARPDAEDLAFETLLPIAQPTADALARVDAAVAEERTRMDPLRTGFGPTLKAGLHGLGRFGYAVRELGAAWAQVSGVSKASTPAHEATNVHLWSLGSGFMLRVKHDPVEGVAEGTQRLFAQLPASGRPTTVFLTWGISLDSKIVAPRFVCVDEPRWTISLARLLAHDVAPAAPMPARSPRSAVVRSKTQSDRRQQTDG